MEARTQRLLSMRDDVLFRAGGCHVFALALREVSKRPLLHVTEDGGRHDHLGCDGGNDRIVDFFGWFTRDEHIKAWWLDGRSIRFSPIEEADVRRRFVLGAGDGYYAHPEFMTVASQRAHAWISKHCDIFDGTRKIAIDGVCPIERA